MHEIKSITYQIYSNLIKYNPIWLNLMAAWFNFAVTWPTFSLI